MCCAQVDTNHDGHISEAEFRQFLSIINIKMSDPEYEKLLHLLGIHTALRRDGLDVSAFQQTLARAADFGISSHSAAPMPGQQPKGPQVRPQFQSPKSRVSAAVAVSKLRTWLSRKYGSLQKMFMAVDNDQVRIVTTSGIVAFWNFAIHCLCYFERPRARTYPFVLHCRFKDGFVTEEEMKTLLEHANLLLAKGQTKIFLEQARRFQAPGGGWRFQHFCNYVLGRERASAQPQQFNDGQAASVVVNARHGSSRQLSGVTSLPDIHARAPSTRRRLQQQGKQLLQGVPVSSPPARARGPNALPTQRSIASEDTVRRLRRRQAKVERQKVVEQLRLKRRAVARAGLDVEMLQRVCLSIYPVWKQLRGLLQKGSSRRNGLCDARFFCKVLQRTAQVSAEDATTLAHSFYEDRGAADGVNYSRFLETIVRNFGRQ